MEALSPTGARDRGWSGALDQEQLARGQVGNDQGPGEGPGAGWGPGLQLGGSSEARRLRPGAMAQGPGEGPGAVWVPGLQFGGSSEVKALAPTESRAMWGL